MKEITHVFKKGDTIDCSGLLMNERKAIIKKAIADGVVEINHDIDVVNICSPFLHISEKRKVVFWRFPRDHTLTWEDITKPIKPLSSEKSTPVNEVTDNTYKPKAGEVCEFMCTSREKPTDWVEGGVKYLSKYTCVMKIQSGEFIAHPDTMKFRPIKSEREKSTLVNEVTDKPYIPKIGEECEVLLDGSWREAYVVGVDKEGSYVFQCLDYPQGDLYDSFDGLEYYRPIKTEGEKLVDLALEQLTAHFMAYMSDQDESTVAAMVELGWRPTK